MKKSNFDPFMINDFSNIIKQNRSMSLPATDVCNNELIGMTFMEKATNMSVPKIRTGLVLLISCDYLGTSKDLGVLLLKNFCDSLTNGLDLPEYIFLISDGTKLLLDESMLDDFKKMKKYGTNIVASYESLEYFNMLDSCKSVKKWSIGEMTSVLVRANQVIKI